VYFIAIYRDKIVRYDNRDRRYLSAINLSLPSLAVTEIIRTDHQTSRILWS
jgi:hypothetical protein